MEFLCDFDFEIKHVKGKENKVANAPSKKFHAPTLSICKLDLRTRVIESQNNDERYLQVKEKLQQGKLDEICEGYKFREYDVLLYKCRLYIPNCAYLKIVIMDEIHQIPYSGHPRYQKTITTARNKKFWHGMKKEIPVHCSV